MFVELHRSFKNHRKVRELARLLGVPKPYARGVVVTLWLEALDACPCTGELQSCSAEDVAWMAEWTDRRVSAEALCDALVRSGLLDVIDDGYRIHDWAEHTIYLRKTIRDRERKRRKRLDDVDAADAETARNVRGRGADAARKIPLQPEPEPEPEPREEESVARKRATPPAPRPKRPVYSSADQALLAHYAEASGRNVRVMTVRAQKAARELRRRGATEQDLADAIDGMLARPHRADDGTEYRELHHAWTDACYERHRERGERRRLGEVEPDSWEAVKARVLAQEAMADGH